MSLAHDRGNCLRNLIRLMCCDGKIEDPEKQFLKKVAHELNAKVRNWPTFVKETLADQRDLWPIADRPRAIATLKSLVAMARADGRIRRREKRYIARFAKAVGITSEQWRQILEDNDSLDLSQSFGSCPAGLYILEEDFEQLQAFLDLAAEHDIPVQTSPTEEFLAHPPRAVRAVCSHAAQETDTTIERCKQLLDVASDKTVAVLNRFQGRQVKYLLELGLKLCVIEPVYPPDLQDIMGTC